MRVPIEAVRYTVVPKGEKTKASFTGFEIGRIFIRYSISDDGSMTHGTPRTCSIWNPKQNRLIKETILTHGQAILYAEELVKLCSNGYEDEYDDDEDCCYEIKSFFSRLFGL